jgi:hypothetical protein
MTNRILVAGVFLAGCAVGGVSSQLVVPRASAQQAAALPRWEMKCTTSGDGMSAGAIAAHATEKGMRLGAERWEPVGNFGMAWCWKRPKM